MSKVPVISAKEAASYVKDNMTVVPGGFVGNNLPETLNRAIETRYLESGSPKNLTLFYVAGQGNRAGAAADHYAHEGLVKRVIGGHWNMAPKLGQLAVENKIEAYNLPQGTLSQLVRDIAGGRIGTITHVGLNTFVDPRIAGGKLNEVTTEDVLEVVNILGEEKLLYKSLPLDIAFLRGTYADENGNVTLQEEGVSLECTSIAQAVKNSGGKVFVQVKAVVAAGSLDPKLVKIPGIYVDGIVLAEEDGDQTQSIGCKDDGSVSGEFRKPMSSIEFPPLSPKKVIGRRAAMELTPNTIVNLGIGIPEYISMVANEEGIGDWMSLTVEAGPIGGVPQGGTAFGISVNPEAILDQAYQFDFYDGGGIDLAFLGLAEADKNGNINVSKFGTRIAGCGGFINITQNAKKVFFCGTFTAGNLKVDIGGGELKIIQEGSSSKFVDAVEQITFSGEYANKVDQPVMYITERAVFELRKDGVYLTEVAPGIDVQTQVIDLMGFTPKISEKLKTMDARIFMDDLMGLKQ